MPESFFDNQQPEIQTIKDVPHLYHSSLTLLQELGSMNLKPTDDANASRLVDQYGIQQTIKAQSDEANPGSYYQLDQYLTIQFILRPFLEGTGKLIAEPSALPNELTYEPNITTAPPLMTLSEYERLETDLKGIHTVPEDMPTAVGVLEIILNCAYDARAFRLGVSAEKFPALEYPVGFGTLPDFFSVAHSSRELGASVLIHRALQNPKALKDLINGENKGDATAPPSQAAVDQDETVSIPFSELQREVTAWAKHLENDWEQVADDVRIDIGKDSTGLPVEVSVQGWARLDLDYDFVHLARKKLSVLMEHLMKIPMNHGQEDIGLLDMLSEENKLDFLLGKLNNHFNDAGPNSWKSDFFLPEYRLLNSVFWESWNSNQLVQNSGVTPLPADLVGLSKRMDELKADPTALEMDRSGKNVMSVPGIVTDIPSDDIVDPEKFNSMHDPLLADENHDELVTPERRYSIYVHPLVWQEVRKYVRSPLVLSSQREN